ncbi:hypothetical protein OG883_02495 [Streptomyces sp. NBC_01142]|uniref:hypothetical protein n=1 Tax=Streptomyces sp. NBC_01142 TaxID=2975865 RepID=UPI00224FBAD1|nr:hypothetical protein [Streptomyces sp. NBC_01142]MCX4818787.1 hypothetical protein [Streptomyces sp. NBC_01142]
MITHTGAVFNNGAISRLLVRAGAASEHPNGCHREMSAQAAELQEALLLLLTLPLEEPDYALALKELGMEVDPPAPYGPGAWLTEPAQRLRQR